ncbi:hypothetical protein BGX31_005062 [Mortierella sp. GBA43]|nr:hypothetical protein BGX31_005062 [Mortierella sp. GBA43]
MFNSPMLLDFNNSPKRTKITKACDNCRRRRVKCDGVPDGCGGCRAAKTQCIYTTSTTKRGPPKGYVEVIEDRLGKIENMLAGIVKRKKVFGRNSDKAAAAAAMQSEGEDNNDDDDHASVHSTDLVEVKKQPPASPALRPERSCTPSGPSARAGSVSAGGHFGRHSPLVSRNRSISSLLPFSHEQQFAAHHDHPGPVTHTDIASLTNMFDKLGTTSVRTTVPFPWLAPEQSRQYGRNYLQFSAQSLEPPLPTLARSFAPTTSADATLQLLTSFFDTFNTFLPILHRPTFMKQWQREACLLCAQAQSKSRGMQQQQSNDAEAHREHILDPVAPLSPLLLNAVLAVASKMPASKQGAEACQKAAAQSQGFFDAARILLDDFLDVPRGQWKATRSSSYLSMAIRMAHELGLNRDPEAICGPDADALRYLWWSMYILDHQFSAWQGLGLLMQGKESDVELPMDTSSSPLELRGFICLVRLVKILGTVLQHSYSTQSLPPQFGGHDSMVSYIEGSLTSWLGNLTPDMRWQTPGVPGTRRGAPMSPMRSPQTVLLDAKRALALAKENSEVYPAYLHIVYNTTLILLHRPYIVGAAGSPAAAQSNTICTGSGRAITDIAQGLDMEHCSYVINRFALYALLQAGVIHAMNAVYDKRGSEIAMEYYQRTLRVLRGFLTCTAYSGGVAEAIKILEQFLTSTAQAAAEEEGSTMEDNEVQIMEQDEVQPNRKKRHLDTQATPSILHSQTIATAVQYHDLSSSTPFLQPSVLAQTTLSMMTPSVLASQAKPMFANDLAQQQRQQPIDLMEQQKQQQLKIQQQHRMYQQLQNASKGDKSGNDQQRLEQQQHQQQLLLRQQLQRQQQKQLDMDMKMKEPIQSPTQPTTSTVLPSRRHALQMLQQQQQLQQMGHSIITTPMTMTMASLTMETQNKMNQMNATPTVSSAGYDPTTFWIDFSAADQSSSLTAGTIGQPGLEQETLRITAAENQFGSVPLWM